MLVSAALAFFAASAAPAQASVPATATQAVPAAKPRRICRSEAVIGSITPKRVCTTVQPSTLPEKSAQEQQAPAQQAPTPASTGY